MLLSAQVIFNYMKKTPLLVIGGVVVILTLIIFIGTKQSDRADDAVTLPQAKTADVKNISYIVDGTPVLLVDGIAERELAPGALTREKIAVFGEPTEVDLDGDGDNDAVTYLTRDGGGSGTFFYVVAAVNDGGSYTGTNAMFLGDRIAPQNIVVQEERAVANFAVRKVDEPYTTAPSVGKSLWIHLDPKTHTIGEFVKDFEGEADPARMTLGMKSWSWVRAEYTDGTMAVTPKKPDVFGLSFKSDGTVSVKTDCNAMSGSYVVKENSLTFGSMMSTMMFCEGSQEGEFSAMLADVSGFHFTGKGELYLELKDKKGSIIFR